MSAEYVKLASPEMLFGESNLLQSQMGLLTMLKQYQEYEVLRKEELFLKIELKKKIGEAKEFLDVLSKSLPESKFLEEQEKKEKMQKELVEKIESVVTKSKKREWTYWKEKEVPEKEKPEKLKGKVTSQETAGVIDMEEPKSSIDKELEDIRKKLEKLQ